MKSLKIATSVTRMKGTVPIQRPQTDRSNGSSVPRTPKVKKRSPKFPRKINEQPSSNAVGARAKSTANEPGNGTFEERTSSGVGKLWLKLSKNGFSASGGERNFRSNCSIKSA